MARVAFYLILMTPTGANLKGRPASDRSASNEETPDFRKPVSKIFELTADYPRLRAFMIAIFCEAVRWAFREAAKQRPSRVGAIRRLNRDEFDIQRARCVAIAALQVTKMAGDFLNCVSESARPELSDVRRLRLNRAMVSGAGRLKELLHQLRPIEEAGAARTTALAMSVATDQTFDAILSEIGYFNPAPSVRRQASRQARIASALDVWGGLLPIRIANEDLGEFLEDINRRIDEGQRVMPYVRTASALFWTAVNSIGYLRKNLR
jgi:hypothetical protein